MRTRIEDQDLDVSLLRTFLAVVQHGSMGKTAAAVDKTQPAVSARILRLEKIVGQKLFARGRHGAKLTHHGELLMAYANRAVNLNEEALGQLRAATGNKRIVLGVSPDVSMVGFSPAIKSLCALHPGQEIKITVADPNRLGVLLNSGKLDFAITDVNAMNTSPTAEWSMQLQWTISQNCGIDLSRSLQLVLFERPCAWQDEMLNSLNRAGRKWKVSFESASLEAIVTAVQCGIGITALPDEIIRTRRLTCIQNPQLQPPPRIQFGLFQADMTSSEAGTALELALDSTLKSGTGAWVI